VVNVGREDTESDGVNEDEDIVELMTSGSHVNRVRARSTSTKMQSFQIQCTDLNAMISIRGYTRV